MTHLLHDLLQCPANDRPNSIAVVDGDRVITYSDLDLLSNKIAHLLTETGVKPGDRVGLYLRKSLEAVAGAYGIMKAGAAYVPLDPEAPIDRIGYIVSNCDIHTLLTSTEKAAESNHLAATTTLDSIVALDPDSEDSDQAPGQGHHYSPSDIARQPGPRRAACRPSTSTLPSALHLRLDWATPKASCFLTSM